MTALLQRTRHPFKGEHLPSWVGYNDNLTICSFIINSVELRQRHLNSVELRCLCFNSVELRRGNSIPQSWGPSSQLCGILRAQLIKAESSLPNSTSSPHSSRQTTESCGKLKTSLHLCKLLSFKFICAFYIEAKLLDKNRCTSSCGERFLWRSLFCFPLSDSLPVQTSAATMSQIGNVKDVSADCNAGKIGADNTYDVQGKWRCDHIYMSG